MNKELPHSQEAEQTVLGSLMMYPNVVKECFDLNLQADEFYLDIHKRIYKVMQELIDQGSPVDVTTVITRLQDTNQLNQVGGADYVIKLSGVNTRIYCAHLIEIIKNRAHIRRLIMTAELISEQAYDGANSLDEIMDQAEHDILEVTRSRRATDFRSSKDVVSTVMQELIQLRAQDGHITGVKTGYIDLDQMTNGFQRGDLIILAARPAMGKTAFALNLALNASFYNPGAIAIFSLEMPAEALMKRILSAKSSVESSKLRSGNIREDEFNKLNEAANELMATKLFVDDSSTIKVSEIFSKCRKLRSEHGLDLVVIDYLQLISGSGKGKDNRQQEISEISRSLKGLAREMQCPVIALSQLSRSVETRPDKHPMLSDLRESGAIEQDADIVMFLYRDDYYNKDENEEEQEVTKTTDVDLAKHRNGATGRIQVAFQKNISAFFNISHREGGY